MSRDKDDSQSSPHAPSFPPSLYAQSSHHHTSMLDLDDDPRASIYSSYPPHDSDSHPDVRISLLGPKMRFHSPAPWELDEDSPSQHQDHPSSRPFFGTSIFSSKHKDHHHKPSPSISSDCPRPSVATRPSVDSSYSQVHPKRSFESTSSKFSYPRGALYALAQESLSATSLTRFPRSDANYPSLHVRPQSPSLSTPSSPHFSSSDSPLDPHFHPSSYLSHPPTQRPLESRASYDNLSRRSSLSSEDDIHPYANPDLVISYAVDPPPPSSLRSPITYPGVSRSNSTATVTESTTNSSRSAVHSAITVDTSVASLASKQRSSSIQKKGISLPIPVRPGDTAHDAPAHSNDTYVSPIPPDVSNLHGWTQKGVSPGFSLISLEEARAQHSRGPAVQPAAPRISMSTVASGSASTAPFPSQGLDDARAIASLNASPTSLSNSRSRARSVSAGKAKNALQSIVGAAPKIDRRDSEPSVVAQQAAGRSLKHKKSGFMRLLGRGHDKDEQPPSPPPVPSLPESRATQEFTRLPPKRVPVPSLSLVDGDRDSSSPKRTPTLSITTQPQSPFSRMSEGTYSSSDADQISSLGFPGRPRMQEALPQSAPPNISEFPALRLRPVSTLFSAQFDGIVSSDAISPSETDLDTPRSPSPSGIMSPVSPSSHMMSERSDDPALIIKALREEISSAKKAWQMQKWEFEGQIKDLKSEIDELRAERGGPWCDVCGKGEKITSTGTTGAQNSPRLSTSKSTSVVNRPRARTGFSGMAV